MCIKKYRIFGREECQREYPQNNDTYAGFCPAVWDSFHCWPPTLPGDTAFFPCPRVKGNDLSKYAFRTCRENGTWAQRGGDYGSNPLGWTNYTVCINPVVSKFMAKVTGSQAQTNITEIEFKIKQRVAEDIRVLEMFGLALSLFSLVVSLIVFYRFRNLQNNRTRIHKNLFIAMILQVIIRLTVYIDQYIVQKTAYKYNTIETTEYTCEGAYVLLEYAKTAMFLWMFVEGLYLHNMITVAVFQERMSLRFYYILGWGGSILLVLIWGILTQQAFDGYVCWSGYNLTGLFWVLEGPRLFVIIMNLLFLLNIIRVLITKLRESNSTEAQQVRKAVRAAIVLVPLLGITNSIQMLHSPVDKTVIEFAIWSYVTTFLTSFQGFFCALIYCFLNGEVQLALKRFYRARKNRSELHRRRSQVALPGASSVQVQPRNKIRGPEKCSSDCPDDRGDISSDDDPSIRSVICRTDKGFKGAAGGCRKLDPFFQNWSDGELSSHNHVDVEQIEIPMEYLVRHKQGQQARVILERNGTGNNILDSISSKGDSISGSGCAETSSSGHVHPSRGTDVFLVERSLGAERTNGKNAVQIQSQG